MIKKQSDCAFVTIIYGADATEEQAKQIEDIIHAKYGDIEVTLVNGGQPVYYFIISAE